MIRDFTEQMDDRVFADLMNVPKEMIVAVDIVTIDKGDALREINRRKVGGCGRSKAREKRQLGAQPEYVNSSAFGRRKRKLRVYF